jgi:hypothetical protein
MGRNSRIQQVQSFARQESRPIRGRTRSGSQTSYLKGVNIMRMKIAAAAATALLIGFTSSAMAQQFSVGVGVGPSPYYGYDDGYYGDGYDPAYAGPGIVMQAPAYESRRSYRTYRGDMTGYAPRQRAWTDQYASEPGNP